MESSIYKDNQKNKDLTANDVSNLVSVIIPCYKQAHYLREAIESVLKQTYPDFEIIVVNDGSPDNTSEVASEYSEVKLVCQNNQGLSAARNAGLRHSRGEFIVFLDADDRFLPEALEVGVNALIADQSLAFTYGRTVFIDPQGNLIKEAYQIPYIADDHYRRLLNHNCIGMHGAVMYRRSIFDKVSDFDISLSAAEDHDMYLRIARLYPINCHHNIIAEYRQHDSSMSRDAIMMFKAILTVLRRQKKYLTGDNKYLRKDLKAGIKHYVDRYSKKVVNQFAIAVKEAKWRQCLRIIWGLILYYPKGLFVLLNRFIKSIIFRSGIKENKFYRGSKS